MFSCVVSVERLTGRTDEEVVAFGATEREAKTQAEQQLQSLYHYTPQQVAQLMQQARVEPLSQWCGVQRQQPESPED